MEVEGYRTGEADRALEDGIMGVLVYTISYFVILYRTTVCVSGIWCIYVVRWRIDIFLGVEGHVIIGGFSFVYHIVQ